MASLSLVPFWSTGIRTRGPSSSLTFLSGTRTSSGALHISNCNRRSSLLHCSFVPSSSSLSFPSSFAGLSLGVDLKFNNGIRRKNGRSLMVRAGKAALCLTKRNRSRKSLARTHGFRRRMRTTSGRAVLKRRRAKGRKVLCTKSFPSSGKYS